MTINAGLAAGLLDTDIGGSVTMASGAAGTVSISTGDASRSGEITLSTGTGDLGTGSMNIITGATKVGESGGMLLTTGNVDEGRAGEVLISVGNSGASLGQYVGVNAGAGALGGSMIGLGGDGLEG